MKIQLSPRARLGLALFIAIAVVWPALSYGLPYWRSIQAENALTQAIEKDPAAKEALATIAKNEELKKQDPKSIVYHLTIGNNWGLVADLLKSQLARDKAIAEYQRGLKQFGNTNTILIDNLGNAYRASGRADQAEKYYRLAIEVNPGDPTSYEHLIELYRIDLKKSPSEIIPLYQMALDRLVDNARIVQLLAEYLASIGRYQQALQYYELLAKQFPGQFDAAIIEVRGKISATST